MMSLAYQNGIDDDKWLYFAELHKNSTKAVNWKGATSCLFGEGQGTRQGSFAASEEYKAYNSPMLNTLEKLCDNDTIAGHPATVVAVADDTAPSTRDVSPRQALSHMQVLLYTVEEHAKQNHTELAYIDNWVISKRAKSTYL